MDFRVLNLDVRSASHRHSPFATAFLFVAVFCTAVQAQSDQHKGFADYCKDVVNEDAQHTLRIIMRTLKEDDFARAEEQLRKFRNISLPDERIISVEPIGYLRHLAGLNLSKNKITDAKSLQELNEVETLFLQDNLITDIRFLRKMTKLKRLNLSRNRLSNVTDLRFNKAIVSLSLGGNPRIEDVGFLSQFELVKLTLNGTSTASSIQKIMPQPLLTDLDLSQVGLADCAVFEREGYLPKIRKLLLKNNDIKSIEPLRGLKSLRALDLSGNPLSDISALEPHENLVALNISGIQAADEVGTLTKLSGLLELYAKECGLKEISWLHKMNDKMRTLDLGNNQIADVSPIYRFSDIKVLRLEGNPISDIDLKWLQSLNQLQDFDIDVVGIQSLEKRRQLLDLRARIMERKRVLN